MPTKPKTAPTTIDPRAIRTRDHALVALINGATKAGAHRDRRREASRAACRGRVRADRE